MEKTGIYVCIKNNLKPLLNVQAYCEKNNIDEYEIFIDKVKSKTDIKNRPAMEHLKSKIKKAEINHLIIDDISNLSREMSFNMDFISYLEKNKCKVSSTQGEAHLNFCVMLYKEMAKHSKEELSKKIKYGKMIAKERKEIAKQKEEELER